MSPNQEPNIGMTEILGEHATNPAQPRTSGETVICDDIEYRVASCEQRIKAQYEQIIRDEAKRTINDEKRRDQEVAEEMMSIFMADVAAKKYNWDGKYIRRSLNDVHGLVNLFYLLLRRCHPEMTPTKAMEIFKKVPQEAGRAIGWALGNSQAPLKGPTMDDLD